MKGGEKYMKKILATVLTIALMMSVFGCGKAKSVETPAAPENGQQEEQVTTTTDTTEVTTTTTVTAPVK